jgi:hypothetical protein
LGAPSTLVVGEVVRLRAQLICVAALPRLAPRLESEAADPVYVIRDA